MTLSAGVNGAASYRKNNPVSLKNAMVTALEVASATLDEPKSQNGTKQVRHDGPDPEGSVSCTNLRKWQETVSSIEERCDLSGLSREPVKYQLASTGVYGQGLATLERSTMIADDLLVSVMSVCTEQRLPKEKVVLFAVHQMLRRFGNGSHTATGSFTTQWHKASRQRWLAVVPTVTNHNEEQGRSVGWAVNRSDDLADQEGADEPAWVMGDQLVKSELIDLVVVFNSDGDDSLVPRFPLVLFVNMEKTYWEFKLQYASELFDTMVVDSILGALRTLLVVATAPARLMGDIELLPEEQLLQMNEWNYTDDEYPSGKRLHHLVEEAAARGGQQVALICNDKQVTYETLNVQANGLACHLCSTGIEPEQLVGLFLDKSDMMIATILGVWKSGAAYVPIDPAYPDERVRFVLDDAQPRVIIASERHVHRLQTEIAQHRNLCVIPLEPLMDRLAQEQRHSPDMKQNLTHLPLTSKQLAYVTYTSGTTGFPKGIWKEHTSVVNSITDLSARYGVAGSDDEVILLFSTYVFEPFVRQMLMALTTGNRLAIIKDEDKFDPSTLMPFLQKHRVTYLNGTASVLQEYDFTACPSLKRMILVGENLTDSRYAALRRRFKARIFNEYGFTESAFVTALKIFDPLSTRTDMSLGRPVRNVKCYVLDSNLKRVPLGVTGELYIGGLGISRGYMNREELTRERFLSNPYQTKPERERGVNGLMYKTGDLARWLPGGEVEYLGRADFQIKLRGIRIEPGEIESTLAMYPGIRTNIVVSKKLLSSGEETEQNHLVGYFVCDEHILPENNLLAFLETKLPRYMIPTRLVQLPQIPVTINGKADLRALPIVDVGVPSSCSVEYRDNLDQTLANIWADVLGVEHYIGLDQNFFRLGGHSITCIQLISRVRRDLHRSINLEEIFRTRTVRSMADLLRSRKQASPAERRLDATNHIGSSSENKSEGQRYLANSLQQGFVYHFLKTQQSDAYIMQSILHYRARLEAQAYRAAWEFVWQQHPALRLRFTWEAEVMQTIDAESILDWRMLDWRTNSEEDGAQNMLKKLQEDDRAEIYHLDQGSLMRVYFIQLSDSRHFCVFSCHHSILDGWSLPLLFDYVHEAYLCLTSGVALSNQEHTAYEYSQEYFQAHRDEHLAFWGNQIDQIEERCDMNALLNEANRYKVPLADYDQVKEQRQQSIRLPWGASMIDFKETCSSMGITLHSTLQLVWHLVLHAYGGGSHTVTGTTISGRNLPVAGIEGALGLFINTLPLVIDHALWCDKSVIEAIAHLQDQVNAMNSRGNVELGRLSNGDMKHGLFDTLFVLENYPNLDTSRRAMHQQVLDHVIESGSEKLSYPLAVIAQEHGNDECSFSLCYASELFTDETIQVLLHTVRDTFQHIAQNIHKPVRDIEYLSAGQTMQLDTWNATDAEYPSGTLHAIFESNAQQKPGKIALIYEDLRLTYRELNSRANAMAYYLLSKVPIRPNELVALITDKSEHLFTSILAIWKTGGAYAPIDPTYPDDRIRYILEDTRALAVVVDRKYLDRVRELTQNSVILIPSDMALHLPQSSTHPTSSCTASDLAYVIYTSGTTGRPKGVEVEHHGVVNLAVSLSQIFGLRETDDEVILSFSNYVFDHFVEQMTDAFLNGQTLLVLNDEMRGDKERLYRYMENNRVTYLSGTPSVISMYEFSRFNQHLRRIDCVGEAFSEPVFDKIRETFPGLVINGYGPTEVSITTHKRLYPFPERRTDKSIGCQIANSTSYVLDGNMKRVPIGAVGELYLGGDGVARGYRNRPDLTAKSFPDNPFQNEQEKREGRNGRLYKTGDLVRWLQNVDGGGEVEYLGRNDFQVKIRGQRIELGEIEAILSSYPDIEQSVVLDKDKASDGQKYLVGYYVSTASLSPQTIRRYMQSRLPAYMVPSRLVPMDSFPVTVSGKLDTKALPVPDDTVDEDVVPPRTEVERVLASIWADLLEIPIESIGIYTDFFSLGGDSLKSTRLSFAATQALGITVGVGSLFSHPTIEALANRIVGGSTGVEEIAPLEESSLMEIPVSQAQERLLFIHELEGGGHAYNIAIQLQLSDEVNIPLFEKALRAMVSRHEALRTLLVRSAESSQYCQKVLSADAAQSMLPIELLLLDAESDLGSTLAHAAQHVFQLDFEIPFRVHLYEKTHGNETRRYSSLVFHHSSFDAWSWDIFQRDLRACYHAYMDNEDTGVPNSQTLRVQYKEYAVEHRKSLTSDRYDTLSGFWSAKLDGLDPLHLVTDWPRPAQFDHAGSDVQVTINPATTKGLKDLARRQRVSIYTVVLASYCFFLSAYTSQQDISTGIPMAHRTHPEFESVVGFFVNILPLRVDVSKRNIGDLIKAVHKEVLEAQIHQDMPFQEITKLMHVEHDRSRHPLVQTIFNWETAPTARSTSGSQPIFQDYDASPGVPSVAKFDLNVTVKEGDSSLIINFNYATRLFEEETIRSFLATFEHILGQLAHKTGESSLSELSLLAEHETGQDIPALRQTNGISTLCKKSLSETFESQAAVTPNQIALTDGTTSLSYSMLNEKANRLAGWMRETCVQIEADDCIAIMLDKSVDMIISILAVWKVGAAYVPLDPNYPAERIRYMLHETRAKLLLTAANYVARVKLTPDTHAVAIDTCEFMAGLAQQPTTNVALVAQRSSSLAYVIFTSGTTGAAKGVLVENRSVVQLREALVKRYFDSSNGSHAVMFLSNYVFDFSVEQLILSVLSGNKLIIPPEEGITDEKFYQLANAEQLSYLSGTPSVLQQIQLSRLQHLQMVTSAGEELHDSQYEHMRAQFAGPINNAYGITETTVYNIVTTFTRDSPFTKSLRDELPGSHVYVLNDALKPVPINAVGELYLGGGCVTRGYLNQTTLTKERYMSSPSGVSCKTIYKTGDLVRYRGPGRLEFLGRRDQQIKLRGFRIELAEVTSGLSAIAEVREAAVIPRYEGSNLSSRKITGLIGYYTLDEGVSCPPLEIRKSLSTRLPSFMIPGELHCLQGRLPLTVNGKLDVYRLAAFKSHQQPKTYSAPRNSLEVKLCQLWASLLGVDHCGVDDDLFAMGGDSISSLQLVGDIYRQLGRKITVKDIFLHRTARDLHDNVLANDSEHGLLPPLRADQGRVQGEAPLLPVQEWFLSKQLQRPGYWNHCFTIRTPALDMSRLEDAVGLLHERHDMLRMRLRRQDGCFLQEFPCDAALIKVTQLNVASFESLAEVTLALSKLQSQFDIEKGPLFAVTYLDGYHDGSARIRFALHHLIVDTVSWNIILSDLQTLYNGGSLGMKSSSMQQWAHAVENYTMSSAESAHWEAIREQAARDTECFPLTTDTVTSYQQRLSAEQTAALFHQCCSRLGAGLHDILLMAVGVALQALTGNPSTSVTIEGHGREESVDPSLDMSRTLGWFTSMYPFEIPHVLDPVQGVAAVKERVRRVPNHGIGYGPAYGYSRESLPPVSVNYLGRLDQTPSRSPEGWSLAVGDGELPHGLFTSPENEKRSSSMADITLSAENGQLVIQISSHWDAVATQALLSAIQAALLDLIDATVRKDFRLPGVATPDVDFTPYFTFSGGVRQGSPLFIFPPGEGGAESYFNNIVQGLPSRNLVVFNNHYRYSKSLSTFEELAEYYLSHMQSVQPTGPYHVLGWSFGGILALELAQILTNKGEQIGTMALIDPYFDIPSASKAIGKENELILDPIYHAYHPDVNRFRSVGKLTNHLILFKATLTNNQYGSPAQQQLYKWYDESPMNNLDTYVAPETVRVVPLEGTHFTWVHCPEQVRSMCNVLYMCLK